MHTPDTYEIERRLRDSLGMPSQHDPFHIDAAHIDAAHIDAAHIDGQRTNELGGALHSELTGRIVGAAIEVHRHLGPGQLESVYQHAVEHELELRGIPFQAQLPVAMTYKGQGIGDLVVDVVVDRRVLVELKSVAAFQPVHAAQVLSYLRATELRVGLLINFNVHVLWRGVRRLIR